MNSDKPTEISCEKSETFSESTSTISSHRIEVGSEAEIGATLASLVSAKVKLSLKFIYDRVENHIVTNSTTLKSTHRDVVPPRKYAVVTFRMFLGFMEAIIRSRVYLTGYVLMVLEEFDQDEYKSVWLNLVRYHRRPPHYYYAPVSLFDHCAGLVNMDRVIEEQYKMEYFRTLEAQQMNYNYRILGGS